MATTYTIDFTDTAAKPSFAIAPFTTDGPVSPNDPTFDSAASAATTTLLLHGKGVPDYGERINENLIHLLENFASDVEPVFPTTGQLWFDTAVGTLRIFNGTAFESTDTVIISDTPPADGVAGQIWLDTSVPQLKVCFGGTTAVPFVITAVTPGASGTFGIAGDQTSFFDVSADFSVTGSLAGVNDANYVVASRVFGAGTTTITVTGIIPSGLTVPPGDICVWLATADNFVLKAGDTMTGNLVMSGGATQITLPNAPVSGTDAANKTYVDSFNELAEMTDVDVTLSGGPNDNDFIQYNAGTAMWENHVFVLGDVTDVTASAAQLNFSVGVTSLIQTQLDGKVNDTGDTMTGDLIMSGGGTQITLPNAPLIGTDATNKTYVDAEVAGAADGVLTTGVWDDVGKILTLTTSAPSIITVDQEHNHEALELDYTLIGATPDSNQPTLDKFFQPFALPTLGTGIAGQYALDGLDFLKAAIDTPEFNGQVFITTSFQISAVSTGASGTFTIDSGDQTSILVPGFKFVVGDSFGNDNDYVVLSRTTGAGFAGSASVNLASGFLDYKVDAGFAPTAEIATITAVADVAGSLNSTFFFLNSPTTQYYVWFDVSAGGVDPTPLGSGGNLATGITVAITTGDSAIVVGDLMAVAITAIAAGLEFSAPATGTGTITVTNLVPGNVEDVFDSTAAPTLFTFATPTPGIGVVGTTPTGLANDATVFTASVVVDGGPDAIAVTGSTAQIYDDGSGGGLIPEIDADLTGGTTSLIQGSLVITSSSLGGASTVAITDTDLFSSLTDFAFFRDPIDGDDTTVVTITGTVPDSGTDGDLFWDTVPVDADNASTKNYTDTRTRINRNHFTTTGPTTVFTVPTYDPGSDRLWVFISGIKQIRSFEEVTEIDFSAHTIVAADHWTLNSSPSGAGAYYVWYRLDGVGVDPAPGGIGIGPVLTLTGDSPDTIADATAAAITAVADFTATSIGGTPIVIVTNSTVAGATGPATDAADATAGGLTITVLVQGETNDYEETTSTSITTNFTVPISTKLEFLVVGKDGIV